MKVNKILFVGGPSDGYRKEDPFLKYGSVFKVACFPPWSGRPEDTCDPADATIVGTQTHTYHRKKFRDECGTDHEAFFHSSVKNPMEALLKGYRYHRNKRDPSRSRIRKKFKGIPPYGFDPTAGVLSNK